MREGLRIRYGQEINHNRGPAIISSRQERDRMHSLCLAFLLESANKDPATLSPRLQGSLIKDRETKQFIGTIKYMAERPQNERRQFADSVIGVLEHLPQQGKDLPPMETTILKLWSNLPRNEREIPWIARSLYSRLELPVPAKYLAKKSH